MKTQISNLINGAKQIRRDLSHSKYINATAATSHIGYAGTNRSLRQEIADKVITENPDGMDIEISGRKFHLDRSSSLSGKTIWFSTEISLEDFMLLSGYAENPFKNEESFILTLNNDMTVDIQMFSRRNSLSQWKHRGNVSVGEEFVTIL